MQEYLRLQLVELARRPDPEDLLTAVRRRKSRLASGVSVEAILDARDSDRR